MEDTDYKHFELELDCKEVKELLFRYILNRGDLSLYERWAIEDHLPECPKCLEEYKETRFFHDALMAYGKHLKQTGVFADDEPETELPAISEEKSRYLQLMEMIKRDTARNKRQKRRELKNRLMPYIKFASAAAACVVISICAWIIVAGNSANKVSNPIASQNTFAGLQPADTTVKIELLTQTGRQLIPAGREIAATDQLKKILINGNREMTLNANAVLSIASIVTDDRPGCVVRLSKGEVYTHVEHDGKPFIVETDHGRAVITGTTFNIKADNKQMQLIVTEGSVRFESNAGAENVVAGKMSTIIASAAPSAPVACNTKHLTAWATYLPENTKLTCRLIDAGELDIWPGFESEQINLEDINYADWIEQKRDWFKREFPLIFKFKYVLAEEGIEVDYPELLTKSGLLWRFEYPEYKSSQLVRNDYESLKKLAAAFSRDEKWVKEKLHINSNNSSIQKNLNNKEAFDKWLQAVQAASDSETQIDSNLLLYSLHASVFLSNTRILAWLGIKNNELPIFEKNETQLSSLIQQEVNAATDCLKASMKLLLEMYSTTSCDICKIQKILQIISNSIKKFMILEEVMPHGLTML